MTTDRTIAQYVNDNGHMPSRVALAELLGMPEKTCRTLIREYLERNPATVRHPKDNTGRVAAQVAETPYTAPYTYAESGDTATLETPRGTISTLDELLTAAKVDRDVWEVERYVVNSYNGFIKGDDGKPQTVPLWQIKASLKRSRPAADLKALRAETLAAIEAHAPTYAPITRAPVRGGHILVLSPADAHIGKGAWRAETGEDMDIPGAVQVVRDSVEALTADALPLGIAEIVLVIGNDFLQCDVEGHTTAGTPVSTAGTYRQAFAAGRDLAIELVERLTVHAPVTVMVVPGNHDFSSILHMGDVLAAWFRNAPDVTVDARPVNRKYMSYGRVLLGFTHGNEEKHTDLPHLMAQERPAEWAVARCREFITGHFHRKSSRHYMPLTEAGGVIVRVCSALSRSDEWHVRKGFTGQPAAEAFIYHPDSGLKAQFHYRPRN